VSSSVHVLPHVGVTVAEQIGNFGAYLGQRTAGCQLVQHLRHAAAFQVIGGALVQKLLHVERCLAGACERVHAGVQARVQGGSERGVADLCVNRRIAFLKYLLFDFALAAGCCLDWHMQKSRNSRRLSAIFTCDRK
jgi:hypothetical protein